MKKLLICSHFEAARGMTSYNPSKRIKMMFERPETVTFIDYFFKLHPMRSFLAMRQHFYGPDVVKVIFLEDDDDCFYYL